MNLELMERLVLGRVIGPLVAKDELGINGAMRSGCDFSERNGLTKNDVNLKSITLFLI
jgi:hypothetical protein